MLSERLSIVTEGHILYDPIYFNYLFYFSYVGSLLWCLDSVVVHRLSPAAAHRLLLLQSMGSRAHELSSCGSRAL